MYIKLLQADSWACIWPTKGQVPGKLLGRGCFHCWQCCTARSFCNEKGKISSGEVEDGAGLRVYCGDLGGASRRARETGGATWTHALPEMCQQWCEATLTHSRRSAYCQGSWFFLHGCLGLSEERASAQDDSHPRSLGAGAPYPLDFLVAVERRASFHCVSLWSQNWRG